jgi:hypothetical protein
VPFQVLVRFGAGGNGATLRDRSDARQVLLRSVFAFDAAAAAAPGTAAAAAARCAALACAPPPAAAAAAPRNASGAAVWVVTAASEARPELDALVRAARALGLGTVHVVGLGQPWPGLGQKVVLLHAWLTDKLAGGGVQPSDVVRECLWELPSGVDE